MATYRYVVQNIDKYAGDPRRVVARSKWEMIYMQALDRSPMVRKWISEPRNLNISYLDPLDKKVHQYWPDFLVQYTDGNIEILEVKPLKQSLAEKATNNYDKLMLVKNIAKWSAADRFAKAIGGRFRVITETELFKKKATKSANRSKPARVARKPIGSNK